MKHGISLLLILSRRITFALITLLFLSYYPRLLDCIKVAMSPVLYGRSYYQISFFIGSGLLLFVFAPIARRVPIPASLGRECRKFLTVAIPLLFGLQILGETLLTRELLLPIHKAVVVVSNGVASSTSLLHNHTSKSALTLMRRAVGLYQPLGNGDAGLPFWEMLNPLYSISTALMFVAAVVSLVLIWLQRLKEGRSYSEHTLFFLTSTVSLKACIDGGVFTRGAMFFTCLTILLLHKPGEEKGSFGMFSSIFRTLGAAIGVLILLSTYWIFDQHAFQESLSQIVLTSVYNNYAPLLFTIFIAAFTRGSGKFGRLRQIAVLLGSCTLIALQVVGSDPWRDEFQYLGETIPAGARVSYFPNSRSSDLHVVSVAQSTPIHSLYRTLGLRPGIRGISVSTEGQCEQSPRRFSFDIRIIRGSLELAEIPHWLSLVSSKCSPSEWCNYRIYGALQPCTPALSAFHSPTFDVLNRNGASLFAVRNFSYENMNREYGLID